MDPVAMILDALKVGGAAAGMAAAVAVGGTAAKDSYNALMTRIRKRLKGRPDGELILDHHAQDPDTWERPLRNALVESGATRDPEIIQAAQTFLSMVSTQQVAAGKYHVQAAGSITTVFQGESIQLGLLEDKVQDSHLAELKTEVLGPMLAYLDKYVLPIVRCKAGNIDICFRQIPRTTGLTEGPLFEQIICVRMVTEPLQVHTFGMGVVPELPRPPEGPLVEDARRAHFAELFREWDAVSARFLEYNDACLRYVEMLRTQIVEGNRLLPEFGLQSDALGPEWVNAGALAVIVFLRQIGLLVRELTFNRDGDVHVWSFNALMVAKAIPTRMVALVAHVNKLVGQRDQVQELLATAKSLAAEAAALRATLDEQRLMRKLSGRCQYM